MSLGQTRDSKESVVAGTRVPVPQAGNSPEPSSTHEGHIFLSYAADDRETARRLAEYLESRGWSVWWDRKIPAGSVYPEAIEEALRLAR